VSCDWQCKPEDWEEQQELEQPQPQRESMQVREEAAQAAQPPARTKCNVPLSDSDAAVGLYQFVDHRWNFTPSCDWQVKPAHRQKKTKPRDSTQQRVSTRVPEDARESYISPAPSELTAETIEEPEPLSEDDAKLGLYQLVSPRWEFWPSCDWQCKPLREARPTAVRPSVKPPKPSVAAVEGEEGLEVTEEGSERVEGASERDEGDVGDELISASAVSSMSSCREDTERPSLFQQTGDIMVTLVGDEGEMGLVEIDDEDTAVQAEVVSPEVARDEQTAIRRKSRLEQLMRDLGDQVWRLGLSQVQRMYSLEILQYCLLYA